MNLSDIQGFEKAMANVVKSLELVNQVLRKNAENTETAVKGLKLANETLVKALNSNKPALKVVKNENS